MVSWYRRWRSWRNRRRFAKAGPGCEITGDRLDVDGHVELGSRCVVRGNVTVRVHKQGQVILGDGVELADYAMIHSTARTYIGPDTYIGPFAVLRDTNHVFHGTDIHWRLTPVIAEPITIGAGCYIGASSYVMPGVTIGDGAVIAPQSIVNKSVGANEIWAGSPASLIAHRTDPALRTKLKSRLSLLTLFGARAEELGLSPDDRGD